ncbi:MAG: Na/Pi cotransporter family protein [Bacteroidales bacterium]|nr:Na/Pi cotransporter family protein [Bacteroidales bacterium]
MNVFFIIVNFIGALAVFLFAMKLMSDSLQQIAGNGMRAILGKITNNPVRGILTGAGVTVAVQSSSATTVMVVSFVNAGLLSLAGAVAVIMGANIGTTITAWIITLFGLGESASAFSLPMLLGVISLALMFSKRDKVQSTGNFVMGLAILLLSMGLLQAAMPNLEEYPKFLEAIASMSQWGFGSVLLFVLIGAVLTCLVQASAAMMAITLVMCYNGWIGFDMAVALVMGQNIGTTITANLAAMVANAAGKKAARAHLVFNVVGVILTLIVFRPVLNLIALITTGMVHADPYAAVGAANYSPEAIPMALSIFHTFFNVVNTLILAWFIPQIIKIVNWMVPTKDADAEDEYRLRYIPGNWMKTSELNIESAKLEIVDFSKRVLRMYNFLPGLRTAQTEEEFNNIVARVEKYEGITDRMETEIAQYLTHVSAGSMSTLSSQRVSAMLRVVDNLESIGDAIYQIAVTRKNKREDAVHFSQDLNDNLERMTQLVQHALEVMDVNLKGKYEDADLATAYEAEDAINQYRDQLRAQHLDALKNNAYDYAIGTAYSGLYALYEKLADYVINVSEAVKGEKRRD